MNMENFLPIALDAVVLNCKDVAVLSDFYIRLLGWKRNYDEGEEWADISSPSGNVKIAFQFNENYVPPVWPEEPNAPQQMAHLDFTVKDGDQMKRAVQHAISCGAVKAKMQYGEDKWTTMIDPAGHPFCFVIWS